VIRIVVVAALGILLGCRSNKVTEPVGEDSGGGGGQAVVAPAVSASPSGTSGEVREQGPPPARWALWPMPNFTMSGLPHPASYDVSSTGTVFDRVTGLMWQREVGAKNMSLDDATETCARLDLGGYHDWRVPSRIELVSILDMGETKPSIDRGAFPGTPPDWFWTSSDSAKSPTEAWYVYFYFGYPKTDERRSHFRVRCVRTERAPAYTGDPDAHYEVGGASVADRATGLVWERVVPPRTFNFTGAAEYCAHLNLDRHLDWRVPSLPELETLVDERKSNPSIDSSAFPDTPPEQFWTSSLFGNKGGDAWHVGFDHGDAIYAQFKWTYRVRCVR
jgi:hypothetical protein